MLVNVRLNPVKVIACGILRTTESRQKQSVLAVVR